MSGVPKVRFPGFEGEWEQVTLGELAPEPSYGLNSSAVPFDGRHKYIRITDIDDETRHFAPSPLTSPEAPVDQWAKLEIGDIVFARTGASVGKSYLYDQSDGDLFFAGFLIRFRVIKGDASFVHLQTLRPSFNKWVVENSMRSGQPGINAKEYSGFSFVAPKLLEQRRIADFLGAVDARAGALLRERDGLARFKAGLLQALFARTLRFARPDGSAFPEWEERPFGSLFRWVRTNSLSRALASEPAGEVQNIHYGDVHGRFRALFRQSHESAPYLVASAFAHRFPDDDFCRVGDVVIADASEDLADIGKALEIIDVAPRTLVSGLHTLLARPKELGALAPGFMAHALQSAPVREQIARAAQGISVFGLSKTSMEKVAVPLPHPDEQARIADALAALDTRLNLAQRQVATLDGFKAGLLQAMFV